MFYSRNIWSTPTIFWLSNVNALTYTYTIFRHNPWHVRAWLWTFSDGMTLEQLDFLKTCSTFQSLPDNDNTMKILRWETVLHYDTDLDYNLLNTRVSMRWRPLIDQLTITDLKNWTTPPYANTPNFILFGEIK